MEGSETHPSSIHIIENIKGDEEHPIAVFGMKKSKKRKENSITENVIENVKHGLAYSIQNVVSDYQRIAFCAKRK